MEYKEGKDSLRVESPYHLSCFSGFPFFLFLSHSWVISIRSFDICGFVQLCLFVSLSLLFWGLNFSISGADFLMLVILLKFFCSCLQVFAGWTGWIQAYIWLNRQLLLWSIFSFFNLFFPPSMTRNAFYRRKKLSMMAWLQDAWFQENVQSLHETLFYLMMWLSLIAICDIHGWLNYIIFMKYPLIMMFSEPQSLIFFKFSSNSRNLYLTRCLFM